MQDFRNLEVWQIAHQLTLEIYRFTASFPSEERFGLSSQLRRAAASIGANLAEGCGRGSDNDFARFVQMAMGSASEVEYHLILAKDLRYLNEGLHQQMQERTRQVKKNAKFPLAQTKKPRTIIPTANSQQPTANVRSLPRPKPRHYRSYRCG